MRYYNYWDGDYFIRHMMMTALRREGWSFSTESGARRFQMGPLRERAIDELSIGGANKLEVERFPSSVEMDLFAERGDEVLAIEIKTRLFARIRAEKVGAGFHHSTMHFGPPQSAMASLRVLQGKKGYDEQQDEIGTICEFYRYHLALNALSERSEGSATSSTMELFNTAKSFGPRKLKTAILIPFYCEVAERRHIMTSLRKLKRLLTQQRLRPFPISLWVLTPTTDLINERDAPPDLTLDLFDKTDESAPLPPRIDQKSINHAYQLTLGRGKYRGCSKCPYRRFCLSLVAKAQNQSARVA